MSTNKTKTKRIKYSPLYVMLYRVVDKDNNSTPFWGVQFSRLPLKYVVQVPRPKCISRRIDAIDYARGCIKASINYPKRILKDSRILEVPAYYPVRRETRKLIMDMPGRTI